MWGESTYSAQPGKLDFSKRRFYLNFAQQAGREAQMLCAE
jgi:hypothetical protein